MFCKNVVTLVWWIYKNYSTLVCSICTIHRFFFFSPIIDLCSFFYSIFALFIYSSILVSHFFFFLKFWTVVTVPSGTVATLDTFFFFLLFVIFSPFIYITVHLVFLHCERTVVAKVLWFRESFFFFFFLLNIDVS